MNARPGEIFEVYDKKCILPRLLYDTGLEAHVRESPTCQITRNVDTHVPSFLQFPGRKERPTHSGRHSAWMRKALSSHVVCFVNRLLLTASSLTNSFILTILFIFQRTHSASSCKCVLCIAYSVSLLRDSISQSSLTSKSLADPTRTLRVDHSIGLLQPTVNLTIPSRRQVRHQPPATL
jgi:hypothetical protein